MDIKKLLSMLLVGALLLTALPGAVLADEDVIEIVDAADAGEEAPAEGEDAPEAPGETALSVEAEGEGAEEAVPEPVGAEEIAEALPAEAEGAPVANAAGIAVDAATFPDAGFLAWVEDNADADGDGVLTQAERDAVTQIEMIDEAYLDVATLEGVELFGKLKRLEVDGSRLSSLDLSENPRLEQLFLVDDGYLESLDVAACAGLRELDLRYSYSLKSLDVSGCSKLETLDLVGSGLESVDLKGCAELRWLSCESAGLTALDTTWNPELEYLNCNYCPLERLDLRENTRLALLYAFGCGLTQLELGDHAALEELRCEFNQLAALELDGCAGLKVLRCQYNRLTALDASRCAGLEELWCQGNALPQLSVWTCPALAALVQDGSPAVETDFDYDDRYMGVMDRWGGEDGPGLRVDHGLEVCSEAPAVSKVWLDRAAVVLFAGESVQLTAMVVPETPFTGPVSWSSSDAAVATVADGAVKAVAAGKATITATSKADKTKKATCEVTVQSKTSRKKLKKTGSNGTLTVNKGKQIQLVPSFATAKQRKSLHYSSSAKRIASVTEEGLVTAKRVGKATITVWTKNKKRATIRIKVQDPTTPTKVTLNKKRAVSLNLGDQLYLKATLKPATACAELKWRTSNRRVATVSQRGVVTPVKAGKTVITVSTPNGKSARVTVTVVDPTIPTRIKLNKTSTVTLKVGKTYRLKAKLTPSTAVSELKWTSSAKKVAKVAADGELSAVVTALKKGKATITVRTANGKTAKVKIRVK